MAHLLEHHGLELLVAYYIIISILGTLPPLPENATYMQKWGFAIAHAICGNVQKVVQAYNQPAVQKEDKPQ